MKRFWLGAIAIILGIASYTSINSQYSFLIIGLTAAIALLLIASAIGRAEGSNKRYSLLVGITVFMLMVGALFIKRTV